MKALAGAFVVFIGFLAGLTADLFRRFPTDGVKVENWDGASTLLMVLGGAYMMAALFAGEDKE